MIDNPELLKPYLSDLCPSSGPIEKHGAVVIAKLVANDII